jgi:thioredoxin-dependent peroxiredoxin
MKLQVGDKAPAFECKDQNGKTVKLSDFAGKKVILYFYPKDDTPGCTKEACSLRDGYAELTKQGYVVLGVSADGAAKHQKFIDKYQLPFTLLADEEMNVIKAYGAFGRKKFMGKEYDGIIRMTFVIDENGSISEVIEKVDTADHANQILNL